MSALRGVRINDIVECDIKGRRFYALVIGRAFEEGGLVVDPITKGITWRRVSATQVVDVWIKRRPKSERPAATKGDGPPATKR